MIATGGPPQVELRPYGEEDIDEVLELNRSWVPHVGEVDRAGLGSILAECSLALTARGGRGDLAGMVLVLGPGARYESPNYRWFSGRYDSFRYVDRIAVARGHQGRGLGRRLYSAVIEHARGAGAPLVCAEVNLDPPNPDSQRFHEALGFVEVGRQWTYGDTVEVQLLALDVTNRP